jgi:hypothetical protein
MIEELYTHAQPVGRRRPSAGDGAVQGKGGVDQVRWINGKMPAFRGTPA